MVIIKLSYNYSLPYNIHNSGTYGESDQYTIAHHLYMYIIFIDYNSTKMLYIVAFPKNIFYKSNWFIIPYNIIACDKMINLNDFLYFNFLYNKCMILTQIKGNNYTICLEYTKWKNNSETTPTRKLLFPKCSTMKVPLILNIIPSTVV